MISPQFYPLLGGYERAAERLSIALAARGHKITVITQRLNSEWPVYEKYNGLVVVRYRCIYRPHLHMITALAGLACYLIFHGCRFDLWHVHQYGETAALTIAIGRILRRPVVMKATSSENYGLARTAGRSRFPKLTTKLLRSVNAVAAVSRQTYKESVAFGISPDHIYLLGNGVDTSKYYPRTKKQRELIKKKLDIEKNKVMIFVGRLSQEKNPDVLIRAWQYASTSMPAEWIMVLVGDGPLRKQIQGLISEYDLEDTINLVGQQSNIDVWLAAADVYVLSSYVEGLSNTMLEAMATGLPVISTCVSAAEELIIETGAGVVVEQGDVLGLAGAMVKLATAGDLRIKMGMSARRTIMEKYTLDVVADNYEELYCSLIKGK